MRQSRKNNAWAMDRRGVGQIVVGEAHEIAYLDLPPICAQPKGMLLSATMFKRSQLTQMGSKLFQTGTVARVFTVRVERIYF
jgi:hypothetical protein